MGVIAGALVDVEAGAPPAALFVDADPSPLDGPALHMLRQNGIAIDHAATAEAALDAMAERTYALVILETAGDGFDGAGLCQRIVAAGGPPVLIWSRQGELMDRVAGLELGADDYVARGAHPLELLARTKAMLRRRRAIAPAAEPQVGPGGWTFDPSLNCVSSWRGARSWLTPGGAALLTILCRRPREPIAREGILADLQEPGLALRTVDIFVSRLRRALAASDDAGKLIRTIPRKGYLLDASVQVAGDGLILRL